MKNIKTLIYILTIMMLSWSCGEDFLEPTLSTEKDVNTNINTIEDLQALVTGAYDRMNESDYYGRDYVIFGDVRGDNAFSNGNSGRFVGPGQFFVNPTDAYPRATWEQIYQVIANANIVINAQNIPDEGTDEYKHTIGQAYAIRALAHFDLLRLYGQEYTGGTLGVPIMTEFGNPDNLYPARNTISEVYQQIKDDLSSARSNLVPSLDGGPTEITSMFVPALESRLYLYTKEYSKAATAALQVINSGQYALAPNSWDGNESSGSIFELAATSTDNEGINGLYYILQETNYGDVQITTDLYNQYELSDVRRSQFDDVFGDGTVIRTGKYPSADYSDNTMVIRYAEVLLNYAEALTQMGDANALNALNVVPLQRGASAYTSATVDNVLTERRKELEMEGHRFYDLMRNGKDIVKVDARQTFPDAGIPYGSSILVFPIPDNEINANPSIVQNTGF